MALPGDDFDPDAPAGGQDGLFGLPHTPEEAAVVVIPVPFEATVSFGHGTSRGPEAVLRASWQVDLNLVDVPPPWRDGIAMLPIDARIRVWNRQASQWARDVIVAGGLDPRDPDPELAELCERVDRVGEELNALTHGVAADLLQAGRIPAVLGGDHSVPYGAIRAAAWHRPGIGLLHIDAHADLRVAYEGFTWSHASVIYNLVDRVPQLGPIVQVGVRDLGRAEQALCEGSAQMTTWYDHVIGRALADGDTWLSLVRRMVGALPEAVWITLDVDGLDPALCPHTGTPVPGGLSFGQARILFQEVVASGREIVGFDVVETGDHPWDANVSARLLYLLSALALQSKRR